MKLTKEEVEAAVTKLEEWHRCYAIRPCDFRSRALWREAISSVRAIAAHESHHPSDAEASFQQRVEPWLLECFGAEIAGDPVERNHRFCEEALELVQACGCTSSEAHQLVDYVFGRPVGEKAQEAGGVMVTLAALCRAQGIDMHEAGEVELARIWTKVEKIRAKQAAKPKHSPLPEAPADAKARAVVTDEGVEVAYEAYGETSGKSPMWDAMRAALEAYEQQRGREGR